MDPQYKSKSQEGDKRRIGIVKRVRVILSPEAKEVYNHLNESAPHSKFERMILKAINQKSELIKKNKYYGKVLEDYRIPEEYKTRYGARNLFKVELPGFWRMLYTLTNEESVEIIAFVLNIMDHREYDRKFKKR
jgi:hypothetical protein